MRGFWADESIEWGIWKRKNFIYYLFKYLENLFFKKSDAVVSLTKVGVNEILSNLNSTRVTFKLSEPNKAGLIIPDEMDEDEDITMLVMPVMINDYD